MSAMSVSALFLITLLAYCSIAAVLATDPHSNFDFVDLTGASSSSSQTELGEHPDADFSTPWVGAIPPYRQSPHRPEALRPYQEGLPRAQSRRPIVGGGELSAFRPYLHLEVAVPQSSSSLPLDRNIANMYAVNAFGGTAEPVPASLLDNPRARAQIEAYGMSITTQPDLELHYQPVRVDVTTSLHPLTVSQTPYVYLFLPISQQELALIVPERFDRWSRKIPVLTFQVSASSFKTWRGSTDTRRKLEFSGLEMIQPPRSPFEDKGVIPRASLSWILSSIKAEVHGINL